MSNETGTPKRWPLALAIAGLVASSASASGSGDLPGGTDFSKGPGYNAALHASGTARYIVRFVEPALASYSGNIAGLPAAPKKQNARGRARLDASSAQAMAYVATLVAKQTQRLDAMSVALGRSIVPVNAMQHALNAVVVDLDTNEAARVAKMDGVAAVEQDTMRRLASDIGPGFIGASSLWWGMPATEDTVFVTGMENTSRFLGDGVVIGDLDTGYNSKSPSFAATDDDGYTITNPLGHGHFIGQCGTAGISLGSCNDKVIGVYDFVTYGVSVEDTVGHGSHTASTAGGNNRSATLSAYSARISGVAPHANLVIYRVCDSNGCAGSSIDSAINQAIADGIIDVINFSISGGVSPWNDSNSLAFLAAENAGIFVAAAAGNTNTSVPTPVPGSVNHQEPWTTTVAASSHTGGPVAFSLTTSGAGAPTLGLEPAAYGKQLTAAFPATTLKVSPTYGASGDGCTAFAAGTFTGAIALMRYDGNPPCSTDTRAGDAKAAGAAAVVIGSQDVQFITSGANQTIPVFTTPGQQLDQLATYVAANPGVTASIGYPAKLRAPMVADVLGSFSLLGPAATNVVKPDVQAPGVSILAAIANDNSANGANLVGMMDGTSMATPHTTGTGALLVQIHPDWTPMEIKSAIMMTTKEDGLTKPNGLVPSDFYDRGAGRIQADVASRAGLVLNETQAKFQAADPSHGGDPATLNLASMDQMRCIDATTHAARCAFARTLRSTLDHAVNWTATLTGDASGGSVSPSSFQVAAGATTDIGVNVDASAFAGGSAAHFGELVLTPDDGSPVLHMPIAFGAPPPAIAVTPNLAVGIPSGSTTNSVNLPIGNIGGPSLNVDSTNYTGAGNFAYITLNQPTTSQGYGVYSDFFTESAQGTYAADDFQVVGSNVNLSRIVAPGFPTTIWLDDLYGNQIHFRIYHDAGGKPDGSPDGTTPLHNAPVWSYDAAIGDYNLDTTNDTITLDLATIGASTNLAGGHYWMVVYPEMSAQYSPGWAWFLSDVNQGSTAVHFIPGSTADWTALTNNGVGLGMALRIEQQVTCGAPWLSVTPSSLNVAALDSTNASVTVDSTHFGGGTSAVGYLCLHSNDSTTPVAVVRVNATQN